MTGEPQNEAVAAPQTTLQQESAAPGPAAAGSAAAGVVRGSTLLASLQSLAVTVVIAVFVITFSVQAFQIPSPSMENTLLVGDYLLVDKLLYSGEDSWAGFMPYRSVQRGDVVVFRYPVHPEQHFVKRVVGLPGDRLRIRRGVVWINGRPLEEQYAIHRGSGPDEFRDEFPNLRSDDPPAEGMWLAQMRRLVDRGQLIVPEGHYFVLGDNRDESLDSRYWGFVPRESIIGRPLLIYFSMDRPHGFATASAASDATLSRLSKAVSQTIGTARWDRMFRPVR